MSPSMTISGNLLYYKKTTMKIFVNIYIYILTSFAYFVQIIL